jgi:hypothetical protein
MISKLSITNFKGIADTQEIEFKPITLLFGPNSGGKSTILQALFLFREILEKGEVDIYKFSFDSKDMDLGGFLNYVHDKDPRNSVILEIEFTLPDDGSIDYSHYEDYDNYDSDGINEYYKKYHQLDEVFSTVSVGLEIGFSIEYKKPILKKYYIKSGDALISSIINIHKDNYAFCISTNNNKLLKVLDSYKEVLNMYGEETENTFTIDFSLDKNSNFQNCLPKWGNPIHRLSRFFEPEIPEYYFLSVISDFTVSTGELLLSELRKMNFIGPIREIPSRNYEPHYLNQADRWFNGLAAWDKLFQGSISEKLINLWLSKLKVDYQIKSIVYKEVPVNVIDLDLDFNPSADIESIANKMKSNFSAIETVSTGINTDVLKMFIEIRMDLEKRYDELRISYDPFKNVIKNIGASLSGAILGGPLGLAGSILGLSILNFKNNKISEKEFTNEAKKKIEDFIENEKQRLLEVLLDFEKQFLVFENRLIEKLNLIKQEMEFKSEGLIEILNSSVLELKLYIEKEKVDLQGASKYQILRQEIEKIPSKRKISLVDNRGIEHLPHDIGIGISQVLPVIVGSLSQSSSILAIEQPELHIHPAVQVELADLFIDGINKFKDTVYLLETHSEHILLRLLKRIKQTSKNENESISLFSNKLIHVFLIENENGITSIKKLNIDERGRFTSQWPKGFFEERIKEI